MTHKLIFFISFPINVTTMEANHYSTDLNVKLRSFLGSIDQDVFSLE